MLVGRSEQKLDAAAEALAAEFGVRVHTVAADLARPNAAERLAEEVRARGLEIDALVNDAGFGYDARFAESDGERQRELVQVNVAALTALCHAFAPGMVARGRGAILNVASVAGFMAGPGMSTYYASKAYVQSFTQALHIELLHTGVHVSALCPGPVRTPFWERAEAGRTALAHTPMPPAAVARAGYAALKANKTLCTPGLAAKVVVFASRILPRSWIARIAWLLQYRRRP